MQFDVRARPPNSSRLVASLAGETRRRAHRRAVPMKMRLKNWLFAALFAVMAGPIGVGQPQLPEYAGMMNDFAQKLSEPTRQGLESLLERFRDRSGVEVAVVTLKFDQLGDYPPEQYALELGRKWGVGRDSQKRALLLLVAIREPNTGGSSDGLYHGSTRLEVSRHLEGDIPAGLAG